MYKILATIAALASIFIFPAAFTALVVFIAALLVPPIALVCGILIDLLYSTPGVAFPYATSIGLIFMLIGFIVQHLMKTRIMGQ